MADSFKVFKKQGGEKDFFQLDFMTRKSARIFCKKQSDLAANNGQSLWIAHPDGSEEEFV